MLHTVLPRSRQDNMKISLARRLFIYLSACCNCSSIHSNSFRLKSPENWMCKHWALTLLFVCFFGKLKAAKLRVSNSIDHNGNQLSGRRNRQILKLFFVFADMKFQNIIFRLKFCAPSQTNTHKNDIVQIFIVECFFHFSKAIWVFELQRIAVNRHLCYSYNKPTFAYFA